MFINKSQITAVILAGGKGQRMLGKDKGLEIYKGKPLIQHVINRITPQIDLTIISANRNFSKYSQFNKEILSDELNNFQGPLAGFMMAMQYCKQYSNTEYILTMPCDAPLLADNYVNRMIKAIPSSQSKETIVVAHDDKRLQSVHALIPVSLLNHLQNYLNNGDRKIGLWYEQNDWVTADFSDNPESFFNINTEEQLNG